MKTSLLTLAALALLAAPAQAAIWQFNNIPIDGLQETPPNASPGSGLGQATLDDVTGAITISGSFSGLLSNVTAAHLHGPAAVGVPAGVIYGLTITPATSGVFSGNSVLPPAHVANVLNGLTYINIHTSLPGGEIRGQLLNGVPEPATLGLLGLAAVGLVAARRRGRA